ncbi:MAG TPA: response regulator [Saprospiraceae bacterium]|nr:response regulator [Saprospiraceae bacterium]
MKHIKLFWIDDMEAWASSAQKNLEIIADKYGITLHIINAVNGDNVCQQLMMHEFDFVVMDYHMEPFRGDKYIADIRSEEHLDGIPIIFYSQDNSIDISSLVANLKNVTTVYRPNLEDKIKELLLAKL